LHIIQHLKNASNQLENLSDSPRLDAEVLLAHSLKKNRTWLATWPDKKLTDAETLAFDLLLKRRLRGEPIAHITGIREFWSLELNISKDTLIPRPETELMVEKILERYPPSSNLKLLDLGTGSGAIALAVASERPNWSITATDKSTAALNMAKLNAQRLELNNINFLSGNWFEPIKMCPPENQLFDIITSNPPYIPQLDPHLSQGDVRFEPLTALASGADGLDDIRLICTQAPSHLKSAGMLIIEHGFDQKIEIHDILQLLAYKNICQYADLANQARLSIGLKP